MKSKKYAVRIFKRYEFIHYFTKHLKEHENKNENRKTFEFTDYELGKLYTKLFNKTYARSRKQNSKIIS